MRSRQLARVKIYSSDYCPYCSRAKALLQQRGVTDYEEIVVDGKPELRARMTQLTGRRSVPQVCVGETHVGGCDDRHALDRSGGLVPLLQA